MSDESSPERSEQPPSGEWDSDEALEFLKMERQVNPTEQLSDEGLTKKLLTEAAPIAAVSIINLAKSSSNDNTRLNASKYIIDSVFGGDAGTGKTKLEELLGDVVSKAEVYANDPANAASDE